MIWHEFLMRNFLALVLLFASAEWSFADQSKIQKFMSGMNCTTIVLNRARPQAVLQGVKAVWTIINVGRTSVVVRTQNDPTFNWIVKPNARDALQIFVGDTRYRYSISLVATNTQAKVHVCRAPGDFSKAEAAYKRGDYATALKELRPLAERGFPPSSPYYLGIMYEYARGVPKDLAVAFNWYLKAAEQGHAGAQSKVGSFYSLGYGVTQDSKEGTRWSRKAAEQGDAPAQRNLGVAYRDGLGVPRDYAESVKWFRKAARQGNATAQFNIGVMYFHQKGVMRDYGKSLKWFSKAADQGYANAQFSLGKMLRLGRDVPQDNAEAVRWYRMAAEQGHGDAQVSLGFMYNDGRGVKQDLIRAYKWINLYGLFSPRAGAQDQSVRDVEELARQMTPSQITEAQKLVRDWLDKHKKK